MKITTFRVPGKVSRQNGTIVLELDETKKEKIDENVVNISPQDIPKEATTLAQDNENSRTIARNILMGHQNEAEVFLELKYLTD